MHIAKIKANIDSLDRYLVTGSDNKTIKIWELKSGRIIKRLTSYPVILRGLMLRSAVLSRREGMTNRQMRFFADAQNDSLPCHPFFTCHPFLHVTLRRKPKGLLRGFFGR